MAGNDENTYGFRKDDADALVASIGMGETETPGRRARNFHGIIVMTPSGGIPARVGITVGKADCTIYRITDADVLESTGTTISVVNIAQTAVLGGVYGQAKRAAGRWVVDFEECEVDEGSSVA